MPQMVADGSHFLLACAGEAPNHGVHMISVSRDWLRTSKQVRCEGCFRYESHIIAKFPFRINTIRTDNRHEFQAKFHWHLEDIGIRHAYIKPRTPRLNDKVERSHGTDQREFYQLLTCEITPRAARECRDKVAHTIRYDLPPPALAGWLASDCATAVLSVAASIVRITLVAQWMPPACV